MPQDPNESAILTLGIGEGDAGALLVERDRPPVVASLSQDATRTVQEEIDALLAADGGLLIPGEDSDAVERERFGGQRLAALLQQASMRGVSDRLGQLAGRAEARGQPLDLLIDARTEALRGLPWELLEAVPEGAFVAAGCRVARLCDGAPPRPRPRCDRLEVVGWIPDGEDRVCQQVAGALTESLASLRRTSLRWVGEDTLPPAEEGVFRVVHVICHGQEQLARITMKVQDERAVATDTVLRWMGPTLRGAGLVVLDVCGAGAGSVDPLDAPAWRLVRGGVTGCLAPQRPFDAEASAAFSRALYGALTEGLGLMDAVAEGRRALTRIAMAHASFRWWNPLLVVGDGSLLTDRPPLDTPSALAGWPRGTAEAEAALSQAEEVGRPQGFLGIEHIAHALSRWESPPPLLSLFQPALTELGRRMVLFGLGPQPIPLLTPRLASLALTLPEGYGLEALLRALLSVDWVKNHLSPHLLIHLGERGKGARSTTVQLDSRDIAARLAVTRSDGLELEVEGGPDDGRRLKLMTPGDLIGRWDPDSPDSVTCPLYQGAVGADRTTSRRHLRYSGGRAIEPLAPTQLQRRITTALRVGLQAELNLDDRLLLGSGTVLRVVAAPS